MLNRLIKYNHSFAIVLAVVTCFVLNANIAFAKDKAAARYEIDAKRIGVQPNDKDALPRSREFLRLDSTYYVGWMYEGIYKFERSSDYLGYKYALPPLEKALELLEKDYGHILKNIYSSFMVYAANSRRLEDMFELSYALRECYNNIEMPDATMALLDRLEKYHFQKDFFGIYIDKAWAYHRNRFFTSAKYSFLKNSVEENEQMAFKCCYDQFKFIQKNKAINDYWYGPNESAEDILSVDHYLALLHNYNQHYDSAEFYYQRLVKGRRVLWGNYAGMQHEIGDFKKSIEYFSKPEFAREHSLSEPAYFLPMLYVYGGRTKDGINLATNQINKSGSTPGFGWYNIALARSYLYDGQLDSCEFYLNKASNFKELHINTTLTQSQYEFTINLLRVQLVDKKMDAIKFFNKGWWYSFTDIFHLISLKVEKMMNEYVVVNELAKNPERKRIVYDLFCGESTITFDETMYLLKDFSSAFFQKKYENYQTTDKRINIQKYFKLFAASFKLENEDKQTASLEAEQLLADATKENQAAMDNETDIVADNAESKIINHEKLFFARLNELLANAHKKDDDKTKYDLYRTSFFEQFPQLVPFSNIAMPMKLTITGDNDEVITTVIKDIKSCNIDWVTESTPNIPSATISFTKKGKSYQAMINVVNGKGEKVVTDGQLVFKSAKEIGKEIALRLFGKGGAVEVEANETQNKPSL